MEIERCLGEKCLLSCLSRILRTLPLFFPVSLFRSGMGITGTGPSLHANLTNSFRKASFKATSQWYVWYIVYHVHPVGTRIWKPEKIGLDYAWTDLRSWTSSPLEEQSTKRRLQSLNEQKTWPLQRPGCLMDSFRPSHRSLMHDQ